MASEVDKITGIRSELPAVTDCVYLNTGTCGPLPRSTVAAIQAEVEHELLHGRIDFDDLLRLMAVIDDVRARFARLLGAETGEIALTHHTTDGMNIGTWGLNWQPGDEIVTTTWEHEGGLMPAYVMARRRGVTLRVVDLGTGEEAGDPAWVVSQLEKAFTSRTRMLSISHVAWNTGACLPLAEIVQMAHQRDALVLVDGAQSAGAIPVDVRDLQVDMYAVPGQKWLCGPEGVGALFVRRDLLSVIQPTVVGFTSLWPDMQMDLTGEYKLSSDARRYEVGSIFRPGFFGMQASLRWLEEDVGWNWVYARIATLANQAAELLGDLPKVRVLTSENRAGLVSFMVEGLQPEEIVQALADRRVRIRYLRHPHCLRASTGFYNTEDDLVRLVDGLAAVLE